MELKYLSAHEWKISDILSFLSNLYLQIFLILDHFYKTYLSATKILSTPTIDFTISLIEVNGDNKIVAPGDLLADK